MCTAGVYIWVYVYEGVRGIRLWVCILGIRREGIRGGIRWRRYTGIRLWMVCGVYAGGGARVYAGGGVRGIRVYACGGTTTWDMNPLGSNTPKC